MPHDGSPQAPPSEDALSGEAGAMGALGNLARARQLGVGLFGLLLLGWLVDRFILS